MQPQQKQVQFDLQTVLKTLTGRIAILEEQNALNLGRIATYEAKEAEKEAQLASVPQNGEDTERAK